MEGNLASSCDVIAQARRRGAELVVFPELSLTGYSIGEVDGDLTLEASSPVLLELAAAAGEAGLLLGFQEDGGRSAFNAAAYYEDGQLRHVH
ncbi:MAG: hypothetical protein H0W51_03305, partial [Euzebyales bacterium]|nr:hypothetical protein [Euzebyales bacterium]